MQSFVQNARVKITDCLQSYKLYVNARIYILRMSYNLPFRACLITAILFLKSSNMKVEFYHYIKKG